MQRGLALIAQRPRTAADLRDRLGDRFDAVGSPTRPSTRLTELGYVDDATWAAGYVARSRSTERGARMLRLELHEHGIEAATAAEALLAHDDDAAALAAARRLARGRDATTSAALRIAASLPPSGVAGSASTPSSGRSRRSPRSGPHPF